jgi:hypothetical protein
MSLVEWVKTTRASLSNLGVYRGSSFALNELYTGGLRRLGRLWNYGTPVYERDWDVLLILDACRPDVLNELSDEYAFLPEEIPTHTSPASQSKEWMEKTFTSAYSSEVAQTAYLSANVFTQQIDHDRFAMVDEVWQYASDDELGTVPPEPVTDRAIQALRNQNFSRTIVHYLQPHQPYRSFDGLGTIDFDLEADTLPDSALNRLQQGRLSVDEVWDAYVDNTRWVLDSVEVLLRNIDAEDVIISADHGEALGEWWCYEHPEYAPLPVLKTVPWVETTATDEGTYSPATQTPGGTMTDDAVDKLLTNLGYL